MKRKLMPSEERAYRALSAAARRVQMLRRRFDALYLQRKEKVRRHA